MITDPAPEGHLGWRLVGKTYTTGANPTFGTFVNLKSQDIMYKLRLHAYVAASTVDWNFGIQLNADGTAAKHHTQYQAFSGGATVVPVAANATIFQPIPTFTHADNIHMYLEADFWPYGTATSMANGRADVIDYSTGVSTIVLFNGEYNNGALTSIAGWYGGGGITSASIAAELLTPANDVGKLYSNI